jgi:hypothetical protein
MDLVPIETLRFNFNVHMWKMVIAWHSNIRVLFVKCYKFAKKFITMKTLWIKYLLVCIISVSITCINVLVTCTNVNFMSKCYGHTWKKNSIFFIAYKMFLSLSWIDSINRFPFIHTCINVLLTWIIPMVACTSVSITWRIVYSPFLGFDSFMYSSCMEDWFCGLLILFNFSQ